MIERGEVWELSIGGWTSVLVLTLSGPKVPSVVSCVTLWTDNESDCPTLELFDWDVEWFKETIDPEKGDTSRRIA